LGGGKTYGGTLEAFVPNEIDQRNDKEIIAKSVAWVARELIVREEVKGRALEIKSKGKAKKGPVAV